MELKSKRNTWMMVLGSLLFLMLPVLASPDLLTTRNLFEIPGFRKDMAMFAVLLIYFHLNYYLIIPRFYFTQKYFWFSIITVLSCIALILIANAFHASPRMPSHHPGMPKKTHLLYFLNIHFFRFVAVFVSSLLLRVFNKWREAEKKKTEAELSWLKAQINPHFFFNTLNTIHGLALMKSEKTTDAILRLSGLMRYVLQEANDQFVPLEGEINYIQNYCDLQKIRFGDSVQLQFETHGNAHGISIAPMLLIPFIENAYKYGVNPESPGIIDIKIDIQQHELRFKVNNHITGIAADLEGSGLGIENTKKRLNLLYPGKHELKINPENGNYSVDLKINLE